MTSNSIWLIDGILSGATTPGQSGPGCDVNEGVLRISQSSCITRSSASDSLVLFSGHSLTLGREAVGVFHSHTRLSYRTLIFWDGYSSAHMQSVYFTDPPDWVTGHSLGGGGVLLLCRDAVGVLYRPTRLGPWTLFGRGVLLICRDAVGVFYRPIRLGHWTFVGRGVLFLCRYAVGVFYRPIQLAVFLWRSNSFPL